MKPSLATRRTPLLDCQVSGSRQDRIGIEESDCETIQPSSVAEYDVADLLADHAREYSFGRRFRDAGWRRIPMTPLLNLWLCHHV